MMKLILSLCLLWPVSSAAGALWCESCTDDLYCKDSVQRKCPKDSMCFTASILIISSGHVIHRLYKDCAPPRVCPNTGPHIISTNLGGKQAVASVMCCDTNECNSYYLPFPTVPLKNGLKCPGCDSSHHVCTSVVHCSGVENTCFKATVEDGPLTVGGCGSPNVCNVTGSLDYLPFLEHVGAVPDRPKCWRATNSVEHDTCDDHSPCDHDDDDCCCNDCCSNDCDCDEDNSKPGYSKKMAG
ncbi:phospholipase A2 inhibitor and Ly6/PLAUR domain-containing protein-like [Gouania willdenowi]|uniref:phospholipase A2 inhibitor and Ly6/PLAUR domain-containing protein-like n=1 Tax=Gouania willdenowi TaxID=441366 RepID=UPI001056DCDB|nr:phospholipase A2 inhibitor and Ly6/PLAUR domain-containing protein-like [Gouania willdenowi]